MVAAVHVVPHEQVVSVGAVAANAEELQQVLELAVDVAAYLQGVEAEMVTGGAVGSGREVVVVPAGDGTWCPGVWRGMRKADHPVSLSPKHTLCLHPILSL